ncbi:response regulator [Synechocystis sp. PCC 7509]|uniref:response regulator n=1 Tax=Synechocystis sp. PCC 7509 TaxID=927677 RepID=UPI0002AC1F72|nr:response regulator [Synechocystis sp. PCC 7509]
MIKQHRTVLIIDDFSPDRETYRRYLHADREYDYTVLEAQSAKDGLIACEVQQVDGILLDFSLPDLDGLEFLAALKKMPLSCRPTVVMITGQGNETVAAKAIKSGAEDYLVKDRITPLMLQVAVGSAIASSKLQQQLQQKIEQEKIVSQIALQIRQSLDLAEVLQTTVNQVRQFLQTDRVVIFQTQPNGDGAAIVESVGSQWRSILATNFYDPCYIDRYNDQYRKGLIVARTDIYNAGVKQCYVDLLAPLQVRACLIAPLFRGEELWGLLIAHHCSSPRAWQESEIDLIKQLSTQIGIAIAQSELYQKVQRELSQRQRVEAELSASEAGLRLALEAAKMGTWDWNILTNQVQWSANMEALFGLQPGEFDGSYAMFVSRLHPEDCDRVLDAINQSVATGAEYNIEFRVVYPNGYIRWALCKGQVFYNQTGQPVRMAGVDLDITPSKQLREEKEVLLLREQAARAEAEAANNSKDEFLAVVSHELRSPLNAILGWARLLRTRELDKETTNKALETIERNTQTQVQLIEDLLDVSRMIRGELQLTITPVRLATVIENTISSMSLTAEAKQIQLEVTLSCDCQILGDLRRLQQIITNLLTNAIKFTPAGGRIEICLHKYDDQAQIQVIDTGIGISQEFLPHIFDRFRRANSSTERSNDGLGLGLAIASQLTALHGGTITVSSLGVGKGATFSVLLPIFEPIINVKPEISPEITPPLPLADIRILVVDDEIDSLELLAFTLEESGAMIKPVSCASDALEAIAQFEPDILIGDIAMPQVDGYTLLSKIREIKGVGQIPAIALSAFAKEEDVQKSLEAGFSRHLTKPIEPTELVKAVSEVLIEINTVINK